MRSAVTGVASLIVAMSIARFAYTPILPHMIAGGAVTHESGALLASANLFGYLVGAIPASLPWTRRHRAALLRISLAVIVCTLAAMDLPGGELFWNAVRFIAGVGSAFVFVIATSLALDLQNPSVTTATFSSVGAGIAITGVLIPVVYALDARWETGWLAIAALSAVLSIIAIVTVEETADTRKDRARKPSRPFDAALALLYGSYGIAGFAYVIPATFITTIAGSWSWIVVGFMACATTFAWGPLARRFGKWPMLVASLLVMALACAGPLISHADAGALISSIALGTSFMAVSMLTTGLVRDLRPLEGSQRIGEATVTFSVGQVLGPLAAALSYSRTGSYDAAFLAGAIALVAAAIVMGARVFRTPA